jgi:hypothetical protein
MYVHVACHHCHVENKKYPNAQGVPIAFSVRVVFLTLFSSNMERLHGPEPPSPKEHHRSSKEEAKKAKTTEMAHSCSPGPLHISTSGDINQITRIQLLNIHTRVYYLLIRKTHKRGYHIPIASASGFPFYLPYKIMVSVTISITGRPSAASVPNMQLWSGERSKNFFQILKQWWTLKVE